MPSRQWLIDDHGYMLDLRIRQIKQNWWQRNAPGYDRDMIRRFIRDARERKEMIEQLKSLQGSELKLWGFPLLDD